MKWIIPFFFLFFFTDAVAFLGRTVSKNTTFCEMRHFHSLSTLCRWGVHSSLSVSIKSKNIREKKKKLANSDKQWTLSTFISSIYRTVVLDYITLWSLSPVLKRNILHTFRRIPHKEAHRYRQTLYKYAHIKLQSLKSPETFLLVKQKCLLSLGR